MEANAAQNTLEKEITNLREANRALTLKLRDIEVANDDIERQARHTTSSLEDLESKYNVAIERGVMMEEEIKMADKERETLRIETQRLREELSDLKIEADLLQDKLKKQEARHLSAVSTDFSTLGSPTFDEKTVASSPTTSLASSPLITTPPDTAPLPSKPHHDIRSPPSPPMSDASANAGTHAPASIPTPMPTRKSISSSKTPALATRKSRLPSADRSITPKQRSVTSGSGKPPGRTSATARTPAPRAARTNTHRIPASNSLSHIRSLTAQMQRLEARVQSARSKLPAPVITPPRYSPRSSVNGAYPVPSTVTIRSRKRTVGSTTSSSVAGDEVTPTGNSLRSSTYGSTSTTASRHHVSRNSISGVSRLSFGLLPNRNPGGNADPDMASSRPSSRASVSSHARPASRTEMVLPPRPASRTSLSGRRTPLGRSRSSVGMHSYSNSISYADDMDESYEDALVNGGSSTHLRTPSRKGTYSRYEAEAGVSGIAQPTSAIPVPGRRQSGGSVAARRMSNGVDLRASSRSNIGAELLEEETY